MQVVNYKANGLIGMPAHYSHIVVYHSVRCGVADAIFKGFKRYGKVESVLNEGFAGGIVAYLLIVGHTGCGCHRFCVDVDDDGHGADILGGLLEDDAPRGFVHV